MEAALQGIKVVDFSQWLPGQYCGMVLADFGADVIKVEGLKGDPNRAFAPQLAPGMSSWNLALNRNKKGITVNIKTEEGQKILKKLLQQADVFIEGFRPGYLESKGLGYEAMH
ncbi:MAG: CoA transferase, partial [Acidaminococcaceae bacterium]|nr:CoA transferase [Acidaminococcaceae bacterium]